MHEPVLLREVPTIDDWWETGGGIGLDRAQELGAGGTLQELGLVGPAGPRRGGVPDGSQVAVDRSGPARDR